MLILLLVFAGPCSAQPLAPEYLRCESLVDPVGVGPRTPRFTWEVRDPTRGAVQSAYQVLVATSKELLEPGKADAWDSEKVESDETAHIEYAGKALGSARKYWWAVRTWDNEGREGPWSEAASFVMGLEAGDWKAKWIADATPVPEGTEALPPPLLRGRFNLEGEVARITLFASALGVYRVHVNSIPIGDRELAPEWTDYRTRVQSQGYDLQDRVHPGMNSIHVQLGDGWYAGRIGMAQSLDPRKIPRGIYGRTPAFIAQLEVEYADGRRASFGTDATWESATDGPVRSSDLYDGEVQDLTARWHREPELDFAPVRLLESVDVQLISQPNQPIRKTKTLNAVAMTEPMPGVFVFDLGQNMVGRCFVRVRPKGARITVRHAEDLNEDGTIYTANLRGAPQTDVFTLRDDHDWQTLPTLFTYHGFRYVELTGDIEKPTKENVVGQVFHSDCPEVGTFECSSPLLNKLWSNILWTQRANLMGIPTDCPQRDERLGWTGDILAFAQTACFNMDMEAFLAKWLQDIRDAQADDGRYPDFAPHPYGKNDRFTGVPAWGDAGVFVAWRHWQNYADKRLLEVHFESARRWVDWIQSNNPDLIWRNSRGNDYGDWLNGDTLKAEGWPTTGAEIPKEAFATAFFSQSTRYVALMARTLGRDRDAARYGELYDSIRAAFQREFLRPDASMPGETQAGYAIALHFDLVPEDLRPGVQRRMVGAVEKYDGRISTGFHSTLPLMVQLTEADRSDIAYSLITSTRFPSWGYTIENGATTIWERWDGYVKGRGFQDPGMNSFSHYAIGSVGEWMYRTILGLNPDDDAPGWKGFMVRPIPPPPGGGVTWAKGSYHSLRGTIDVSWKVDGGTFTLDVTVPPNTRAIVAVPAREPNQVREGGKRWAAAEDVALVAEGRGVGVFEVPAGTYRFESEMP